MRPALNQWQSIVELDDVPPDAVRDVLGAVLNHLNVEIVCESTPDYTTYEVRPKAQLSVTETKR